MDNKTLIEEFINNLGFSEYGFIKCRKFYELKSFFEKRKKANLFNEFEEQDIDLKIDPTKYMKDGKTIISIAFPYNYFQNNEVTTGFSLYTRGRDYHKVVKLYLNRICKYIEELGGKAIPLVDSNTLPERYIAYLAGVGFIGKNNMIITKTYGSYVFLGEIITDLDIYDNDKRKIEEIKDYIECGECEVCFKECPTKAINKTRRNSNICVSYMTQKKDLNDKEIKLLNGQVFGCDKCQLQCPYNLDVKESNIDEFRSFDFMNNEDINYILDMSNKQFKQSYLQTSCGWRGKNILKRNALLRLYKCDKNFIKTIKTDSDYINSYIHRLLKIDKM